MPTTNIQILNESKDVKVKTCDVLTEINIKCHVYTTFIYEQFFQENKITAEQCLEILEKVNNPNYLDLLGKLYHNFPEIEREVEELKKLETPFLDIFKLYAKQFKSDIEFLRGDIVITPALPTLLSMNLSKFDNEQLSSHFDRIANCLMNESILVINKSNYKVVECEIYFYSENHPDPYVHQRPNQLQNSTWYFNDFGLDITFGNENNIEFGGVLVRGIKKIGSETNYISGPSNVLREIFENIGKIDQKNTSIYVEKRESNYSKSDFFKSLRVNLISKNGDEDFLSRRYRYITDIVLEHKFSGKEKVVKEMLQFNQLEVFNVKNVLGYNLK